ncbi:hypothetical protein, partial [Asanoa iriomotensis]
RPPQGAGAGSSRSPGDILVNLYYYANNSAPAAGIFDGFRRYCRWLWLSRAFLAVRAGLLPWLNQNAGAVQALAALMVCRSPWSP